MSAVQKAVHETDSMSEPTAAPLITVPQAGEKFSDEEMHAKFGVPAWGGIRVSRENKCIVLVDLVDGGSKYTNDDYGQTITYMGQNSDPGGRENQEMSGRDHPIKPTKHEPADPAERKRQAAANNTALRISKELGYTVLYFIKEKTDLAFNTRVECDSHKMVVEEIGGKPPRVVMKFTLRRVAGVPNVTANMIDVDASPDSIEMVETVLSSPRKFDTRQALLESLPQKVSRESLDRILNYLARSGRVNIDGGSVQWVFGNLQEARAEAQIMESHIETLEVLADRDLVEQVNQSEKDLRAGRVVPWVKGRAQNTR